MISRSQNDNGTIIWGLGGPPSEENSDKATVVNHTLIYRHHRSIDGPIEFKIQKDRNAHIRIASLGL